MPFFLLILFHTIIIIIAIAHSVSSTTLELFLFPSGTESAFVHQRGGLPSLPVWVRACLIGPASLLNDKSTKFAASAESEREHRHLVRDLFPDAAQSPPHETATPKRSAHGHSGLCSLLLSS